MRTETSTSGVKKNKGIKIMAFLALFGIIIGIIGTGLLIIFDNGSKQEISSEQLEQIREMINSGTGIIEGTGSLEIGTGEIVE